jgi:radical SAM-linked protein
MAEVVEKAYRSGAIFCSWADGFDIAPWLKALEECGIDAGSCTGPRVPGKPLPWSHLEAGISEDFLLRERARALNPDGAKTTEDCRYGLCRQCGVCDSGAGGSRLARADAEKIGNRLVFPQRDQKPHLPAYDARGRIICRPSPSRPPQIAPALTVKAAVYRIWHTKTGGSAFLSQLELQAMLDRVMRRAALPLAFSRGFHPLPLLSFGRALPVGVESMEEWFILTLRESVAPGELAGRLATLPQGMDILRVEELPRGKSAELALAEKFSLSLTGDDDRDVVACFSHFAAQEAFTCMRKTKNGSREDDIRPVLYGWKAKAQSRAVTFVADWRTLYLSPLVFCCAVLAALGPEDELKARLRLVKTAQLFTENDIYRALCEGEQ